VIQNLAKLKGLLDFGKSLETTLNDVGILKSKINWLAFFRKGKESKVSIMSSGVLFQKITLNILQIFMKRRV